MNEHCRDRLEFDIRGQICPSTLLTTLREVTRNKQRLRAGVLELAFLTDNRTATNTIPDAVRNMGYDVDVAPFENAYRILIFSEPA